MALATHLYGVSAGFRPLKPVLRRFERVLTLETALIGGGLMMAASVLSLAAIGVWWGVGGFAALPTTLPLLLALALGAMGLQTALGGVLIAVIGGHQPRFAARAEATASDTPAKLAA
jgi:hypothetical protein